MPIYELTEDQAATLAELAGELATERSEYAKSRSLTRSWSGNYTPGPDETQAIREAEELRGIVAILEARRPAPLGLVKLTATYETLGEWPEGADEPEREGGYTDPCNPWGGFKSAMPDRPEDAGYTSWQAWSADYVRTEELTLWDAAVFVLEFPGAVWDRVHDCDPSINYRTGEETTVTLHVDPAHQVAVFELADIIEAHHLKDA